MKTAIAALATTALLAAFHTAANADFANGNIALLRVNASSGSLASSLSLVVYNSSGAVLDTLNLPSTGAGAVTLEATPDNHDGHLNLTTNGQYLVFAGYRADAGTADPSAQFVSSVNRVIVRVDSDLNVNSSTVLTDAYDHTTINAVASVDGNSFWTVGSSSYDLGGGNTGSTTTGGLRYVNALGASTTANLSQTQVTGGSPTVDSYRSLRIQTDSEAAAMTSRLYLSASSPASFVNRGVFTTQITMPTSGAQTIVPVITGVEDGPVDPTEKYFPKSDVVFLDLDPNTDGFDTAYSTGGKADYQKWAKVGSTWVRTSNLALASGEINALDFSVSGSTVTLYASTDAGVYRLIDTGGYNQPISSAFGSSFFITADAGTQFRGIASFGGAATPVPEPASLAVVAVGGLLLLRRKCV